MDREIIVYTRPACRGCVSTKMWLTKKGLDFTEIDITPEIIKEKNLTQAPYVEVIEHSPSGGSIKESWSDFRIERLGGLLI